MEYAMKHGLATADEETPDPSPTEAGVTKELLQKNCPRAQPKTNGQALLESAEKTARALLEGAADTHAQMDITAPGVHQGGAVALLESRSLGIQAWERLPVNSYVPLMHALVQRGPAAVAVFASQWFQYAQGIFDGCEKDAVINHAVAMIGYGQDKKLGEKYWLIQNSWGPEWGENGRIRLLRKDTDDTDYCGVDAQPKDGTGCDGGPAQVKVCGMCGVLYDTVVPHF